MNTQCNFYFTKTKLIGKKTYKLYYTKSFLCIYLSSATLIDNQRVRQEQIGSRYCHLLPIRSILLKAMA